MLGSNPSADSVASTDRNGDASASPFHLRVEHLSGEASKRQILGVRGQSPCVTACFRSESRRRLIMRALLHCSVVVNRDREMAADGWRCVRQLGPTPKLVNEA